MKFQSEASDKSWTLDQMVARLSQSLSRSAQNANQNANHRQANWDMTPELAYGRHRGPSRIRSRQAAVAVTLMLNPDSTWTIPLTRRPTTLRHHGGQICFPGGRIETDENAEQAALREYEEELGVALDVVAQCGRLPQQYVYASDNEVTPIVFVTRKSLRPWSPDPVEVDQVIELPLSAIVQGREIVRTPQERQVRGRKVSKNARFAANQEHTGKNLIPKIRFNAPAFHYQDKVIWGATAVILDQLAQALR